KGAAWDAAMRYWEKLRSDEGAHFDHEMRLDAAKLPPIVTWGTSPEDVISVTGIVPDPDKIADEAKRLSKHRALKYMGLTAGTKIAEGKQVSAHVNAMVVPGSGLVKEQAEAEGLDKIFITAGFEWREPGCSMCLAMNPDKLKPEERCASTSNRNFEGRQGFK